MSRKRTKVGDEGYEYEQFIWKENGAEQKMLEDMFSKGIITEKDTPKSVRDSEPLFQKFSQQVFGAHFRKIKKKMGKNEISEICGPKTISVEPSSSNQISYDNSSLQSQFNNPPVLKLTYFDFDEKCIKVCVAVAMIAGATDIKFDISEDGTQVSIEYAWPTTLFRAHELFEEETKDKAKAMNTNHPKVLSMITELLNVGITEHSVPKGNIVVVFPIKVQKEIGSWSKKAVKQTNGARVAVLEFKGFMQQEIINDADTTIVFD